MSLLLPRPLCIYPAYIRSSLAALPRTWKKTPRQPRERIDEIGRRLAFVAPLRYIRLQMLLGFGLVQKSGQNLKFMILHSRSFYQKPCKKRSNATVQLLYIIRKSDFPEYSCHEFLLKDEYYYNKEINIKFSCLLLSLKRITYSRQELLLKVRALFR